MHLRPSIFPGGKYPRNPYCGLAPPSFKLPPTPLMGHTSGKHPKVPPDSSKGEGEWDCSVQVFKHPRISVPLTKATQSTCGRPNRRLFQSTAGSRVHAKLSHAQWRFMTHTENVTSQPNVLHYREWHPRTAVRVKQYYQHS